MDAKIVLDISAIVWDENDFNTNSALHYKLASEMIVFIRAFESCKNLKFVARTELLTNVMSLFPYNITNRRELSDFKRRTQQFLSNRFSDFISYNAVSSTVITIPNICYNHFAIDLQTEIGYLITEIHNSSDKHIFCTFHTRWQNDSDLQTNNGNSKTHKTIVHENANSTVEDYYLNNVRNIFDHNTKHDSCKGVHYEEGEKVNPLRCYDERKGDITIPQKLLDDAIQYENEFYNYDDVNRTFVCFKNHLDNKYHGYDEDKSNVPQKIREEFHK